MVIFEFGEVVLPGVIAPFRGSISAALRLLRTCRNRVATAAPNTRTVSTTENAVHGKCGVVNSLTKFFDDMNGVAVLRDVLTGFQRHPIESRAVGPRPCRAHRQHRRTRVRLPDLGRDIAQRGVDRRVGRDHHDLEVDALLAGVGDDLPQFRHELRIGGRHAHTVVARRRRAPGSYRRRVGYTTGGTGSRAGRPQENRTRYRPKRVAARTRKDKTETRQACFIGQAYC